MRYAKGHGTGNDFIILPDADDRLSLGADVVRRLCDRRIGIGADGVLRVVRRRAAGSGEPEWFMDYRNADGSIAEMCGNGIRVFAKYLIEHGLAVGPELVIATRAGTRVVRREASDGARSAEGRVEGGMGADLYSVQMGPVAVTGASAAVLDGRRYEGLAIDVGNPHLACIVDRPVASFELTSPPEVDPAAFPDGVNVEVVRPTGERAIEMRVVERGSGETRSCGTGAVAAAAAAASAAGQWPGTAGGSGGSAAWLDSPALWTVDVPGGRLTVGFDAAGSLLTGPAVMVAEGRIAESWLVNGSG